MRVQTDIPDWYAIIAAIFTSPGTHTLLNEKVTSDLFNDSEYVGTVSRGVGIPRLPPHRILGVTVNYHRVQTRLGWEGWPGWGIHQGFVAGVDGKGGAQPASLILYSSFEILVF